MIDLDVFQQELAKLSEWDAQGMRYGYEIDVEYINGRVQRNESGTRKNRADDFQKDVERLARDNRVGRIFVRLFRGTSTNAKRMDTTKAITDDTPDIVLRVNSESLAASLATNKKDEATHTSAGGMGAQDSSLGGLLGTLLGVGSGRGRGEWHCRVPHKRRAARYGERAVAGKVRRGQSAGGGWQAGGRTAAKGA